ncbi:GntR family transcriptional regulator [Salinisphaera sp. T31B1]|uniref:GntR family transcriptional regulator n=1 Tax=Salinisphaera sp. T31B1 TaxID=727963 RepID=UPI0033405288
MNDAASPNYQPLYQQIKTLLVSRLAANEWPPGTALPSEIALAQAYNVSQGTVRKALNELEIEHMVERRQGRGTFAARHSQQRSLFQFFHLLSDDNVRELPVSRVLSCATGEASACERRALNLTAGASVTRIRRVRDLNQRPVISESLSVPTAMFPGLAERALEEVPNTLYEFFETQYGVVVAHASERLRAAAASETDAELLGVSAGAPLLAIERRALNLENRPVEWRLSYCDTAHHFYLNELD